MKPMANIEDEAANAGKVVPIAHALAAVAPRIVRLFEQAAARAELEAASPEVQAAKMLEEALERWKWAQGLNVLDFPDRGQPTAEG